MMFVCYFLNPSKLKTASDL